ncbi:hypothetical protein LIER_21135 [Lithospermum erythrorhizon]|uniref:Uncharacterized protein n=1 Tax=Lithospermum erythrorhizon TaxID=34254 RepID=A0AAV3QRY5_LITER
MGWIWKEDDDVESAAAGDNSTTVLSSNKDGCSTRKIVSSQCRTEEMEPGIFIRKCENTQQIFRYCLGSLRTKRFDTLH